MTYRMFVDDIRNPDWVYADQDTSDWQVCRTVEEAQHVISDLGWPCWISFDHDLGDNIPTGYDLAKWLVEQDLDGDLMPDNFSYAIHSANGPGRENIDGLLKSYLGFKQKYL